MFKFQGCKYFSHSIWNGGIRSILKSIQKLPKYQGWVRGGGFGVVVVVVVVVDVGNGA